jgi:hypothetical protein
MTESLLKLRDYLLLVMMGASDDFPKLYPFVGNAALDLVRAFRMLREALKQSEAEFSPELIDGANSMLTAAHECYLEGDRQRGAQLLRAVVEFDPLKRLSPAHYRRGKKLP